MNNNNKVKMRDGKKTEYGCQKRKTNPNDSIRYQDTQVLFSLLLIFSVFIHQLHHQT